MSGPRTAIQGRRVRVEERLRDASGDVHRRVFTERIDQAHLILHRAAMALGWAGRRGRKVPHSVRMWKMLGCLYKFISPLSRVAEGPTL